MNGLFKLSISILFFQAGCLGVGNFESSGTSETLKEKGTQEEIPETTETLSNDDDEFVPSWEPNDFEVALESNIKATNQGSVIVNVDVSEVAYMRITDDSKCKSGEWIPYSENLEWELQTMNGQNEMYLQFADADFTPTKCEKIEVIQDSLPPVILLEAPETGFEAGSGESASISIEDLTGVEEVLCGINGEFTDCTGMEELNLDNLEPGTHTIVIKATDPLGQTQEESITVTVWTPTEPHTQEIEIKDNNQMDILFVVDNSGSMNYEQQSMANRISNFMPLIQELDWQIGITTTDPRSDKSGGDGKLLPLVGSSSDYVIDPSFGNDAQTILGNTLQTGSNGAGDEQGIRATYRNLERSLNTSAPESDLIREDAALSVILISDEDESGTNDKNDPEKLLAYIDSTWSGQKNFTFHSIITKPGDSNCLNGEGAKYGNIYFELSQLTGYGQPGGAIVGSVCESDYSSQLAGIGEAVNQYKKTLSLKCVPTIRTPDDFVVTKDGALYQAPYTIEGFKVIFETELQPATYALYYKCDKTN